MYSDTVPVMIFPKGGIAKYEFRWIFGVFFAENMFVFEKKSPERVSPEIFYNIPFACGGSYLPHTSAVPQQDPPQSVFCLIEVFYQAKNPWQQTSFS